METSGTIEEWLSQFGLDEFAPRFRSQGFADVTDFADLTPEDFIELEIQQAILGASQTLKLPVSRVTVGVATRLPGPHDPGSKRCLTVGVLGSGRCGKSSLVVRYVSGKSGIKQTFQFLCHCTCRLLRALLHGLLPPKKCCQFRANRFNILLPI